VRKKYFEPAPPCCKRLKSVLRNAGLENKMEVFVDGGIRRGTDIIKALALGATAVAVGRPYLYGLGAGGQAGVEKALDILLTALARDMALVGAARPGDLSPDFVRLPR